MPLIILLIVALVVGYLIARSRASKAIDKTATDAYTTSKGFVEKTSDRLRGRPSNDQLKAWVAGAGASYFQSEFMDWLAALSKEQAQSFTAALTDHMASLGYNLQDLVEGKLQTELDKVSRYASAIEAYSQVYRQARATTSA
jgi:hypothetical protein